MFETGRPTTAEPDRIASRDDFADFVGRVLADYRNAGHQEWENAILEKFLDSLAAVGHAGLLDGGEQDAPAWRLLGGIREAATGYE